MFGSVGTWFENYLMTFSILYWHITIYEGSIYTGQWKQRPEIVLELAVVSFMKFQTKCSYCAACFCREGKPTRPVIFTKMEWSVKLQKGESLCLMEPCERDIKHVDLVREVPADRRNYANVVPPLPLPRTLSWINVSTDFLWKVAGFSEVLIGLRGTIYYSHLTTFPQDFLKEWT